MSINGETSSKLNGTVVGFDYIKFIVGNAKQAAFWYCANFAFEPFAYRGLETGSRLLAQHVVKQNNIVFIFESALLPGNKEFGDHLVRHGDGVKDICFEVDDVVSILEHAKKAGAVVVKDVTEESDEHGSIKYAVIKTYGDTVHTLLEKKNYHGFFLPGYKPHPQSKKFFQSLPAVGLNFIDHCVGNQPDLQMTPAVEWYEKEFVDYYGGAGVQHIALNTNNIISAIEALRARGVEFLTIPNSYYDNLRTRLKQSATKVKEDMDHLQKLHIMVDFDENGYLLQIFSKPCSDRPTLFIEIIQRHNHQGFGAGNFRALFESIELEQNERGNLFYEDVVEGGRKLQL
ncbi:unnamed protein product [Angiostrongylus costaricensis]|uniref:4-hydroxyphenylpyruvate dioxygenase n=1 Tax=Angiostrongylus costaricensis TaxID=334426 RepID=A0A0R3PNI7_ANGCS|nr:unnamed protein product [Angiostrongylus costaricensis]